jgi:metallo-beta-lactamase class B
VKSHATMLSRVFILVTCLIVARGAAQAQVPTNPQDAIDTHLANAKTAAGLEWSGTFMRLCVDPAPGRPAPAGGAAAPSSNPPPPPRSAWYAQPARVFDNLYFLGTRIHSAWALTSDAGIIVIDTLQSYSSEEEMLGGMKKLGLDASKIKYVLLSHSHGIGDHDGGARLIQDKVPGVRLVMGASDWDAMERGTRGYPGGKPKRDVDATDGQKITVGDISVTVVTIPGHTAGTLAYVFDVKDHGRPVTVAYIGGTAINFAGEPGYYDTYIASQRKIAKAAANASVFLSNHTEFDNAYFLSRAAVARPDREEPNPFIVGKDAVQSYFRMTEECAAADKIRAELRRAPR